MKVIMSYIFIFNCILLNAQSLDGLLFSTGSDGPMPSIYFKNNTISLYYPVEVLIDGKKYMNLKEIENKKYSYSIINGIYHITVYSEPKIELYLLFDENFGYFSITLPDKYDSGILLKITNEIIPRLPKGGGEAWLYSYFRNVSIKESSFLKENGREYNAKNLIELFTTYPWVEGKKGAGIGEYIEFDYSQSYMEKVDTIVISNGYFSPNNFDLYYQNNRVKKIRIENIDGNYKKEFEVKDTPNLQSFKLDGFHSRIRITILDVYYGHEYNDTCINYLTGVKLYIIP